ncbi:MAG: HAMP domain-containing histidine kinase [Candidatus Omnitrophica bacterium]|nr:HAMP domain-containing histidine kinase [Candidatus Omnitrophota bacterium]MBU1809388.1 HAMP domain-containing histidine kinase [Candidatus Omnitrophota bacterium]
MRVKIALIFILSVLIPTALLAYFGLQAVRSEKLIVETNIRRVYESMADVVEDEIKTALYGLSDSFLKDKAKVESILINQASMFNYQVKIFDDTGRPLGGPPPKDLGAPVLRKSMRGISYIIAVYEKYPVLIKGLEERKHRLTSYMAVIIFSALFVLCGSFFTLSALSREWRLTELKSEFVASLSHDLRRPLTSIRMFSEMLKTGSVQSEEKKREYYNIISGESEQLTNMANNILDFSRIERGRKRYEFKNEDITAIIRATIERFKSYMAHESCKVTLNMEPGIPPIKIDADSIAQAITNLLTNAFNYSPFDKEITVNVVKRPKEVAIEVIDNGLGIPRSERKKIFRRFYRVESKDTNVEGSGLGLTLVKYAAEAHHGKVVVESKEGSGSKFLLILPMRARV